MSQEARTVGGVLKAATEFLAGKGVEQPRLACEFLAARLLRCKRLELPLQFDTAFAEKQLEAMRRGIRRVAAGEPVQYVLGQWEFMGHTFKTDRRALIPRPETESLVEAVLKCAPLWAAGRPSIVDVGTGSGCIVISLALARPEASYLGLDVSEEAIGLAKENAVSLAADRRIGFSCSGLSDLVEPETIGAVVANLPYIPTADYERLPVWIREHEPRLALDGGPDGLTAITDLIQDAAIALKSEGRLFLEIGEKQGPAVRATLMECGFEQVQILKDLAGRDRVVTSVLAHPGG